MFASRMGSPWKVRLENPIDLRFRLFKVPESSAVATRVPQNRQRSSFLGRFRKHASPLVIKYSCLVVAL
jgi:hypothetical protein